MVTSLPFCMKGNRLKSDYTVSHYPEKDQDFSNNARDLLKAMVPGRKIEVTEKDQNRYGRTVALLSVDGSSVSTRLWRAMDAVYREYCKDRICIMDRS